MLKLVPMHDDRSLTLWHVVLCIHMYLPDEPLVSYLCAAFQQAELSRWRPCAGMCPFGLLALLMRCL